MLKEERNTLEMYNNWIVHSLLTFSCIQFTHLFSIYSSPSVEYPSLWKTYHCFAQMINSSTASVVCGKDPTKKDIEDAVYYGLCRTWDVKYVNINCLNNHYVTYNNENDPKNWQDINSEDIPCWCGSVHYRANGFSFTIVSIIRNYYCQF